jgi:acetylornithine deacetylase
MTTPDILSEEAIALLQQLISTPSFSGEENETALLLERWLATKNIPCQRHLNNVFAVNADFDPAKPTLLLNSHHDTVRPNQAYTRDPFQASLEDGKLYGLGSNDAGGCLAALLVTFAQWYPRTGLSHNLVLVASAEEETSGPGGLGSVLPTLPPIDVALVGEPTGLHLAIAEKGLVVFDAVVRGTPSHAAHPNPDNAIYKAIEVLEWFRDYHFPKTLAHLGEVKLTVTQVAAGTQHNVVPSEVHLVVDVRVNDCYSNQEIADLLCREAPCSLQPRSLRLNSSNIDPAHPLVRAGVALGRETYGSPTLSDQAALSCPSLKMGPGESSRSHSADEFIYLSEIREGIRLYGGMLERFLLPAEEG